MKTKDLLLTVGLIAGAYYLLNKNSKSKNDTNDGSGGGGGGLSPLGYYPVIPAISNPTTGPIEVVVTPIPRPFVNPKPYGTKSEPRNLSQVEEAPDVPSTSNSNTTTGGTTSAPHGAGYTPVASGAASQP